MTGSKRQGMPKVVPEASGFAGFCDAFNLDMATADLAQDLDLFQHPTM